MSLDERDCIALVVDSRYLKFRVLASCLPARMISIFIIQFPASDPCGLYQPVPIPQTRTKDKSKGPNARGGNKRVARKWTMTTN